MNIRSLRILALFAASTYGCTAMAAPQSADLPDLPPKDELCLRLAEYGEQVSLARSEGMKEAQILSKSGYRKDKADRSNDLYKNVISYVFTVGLRPEGSRKVIFDKCKAGDF